MSGRRDVWKPYPDERPTPTVPDNAGLRDALALSCGCEDGMGHMDRQCHSYGLCHAQSAERAGPTYAALLAERDDLAAKVTAVERVIDFLTESAELHAEQGLVTAHYPIAQRLRRALGDIP